MPFASMLPNSIGRALRLAAAACLILSLPAAALADDVATKEQPPQECARTPDAPRAREATVYLPIYSHIYFGDQLRSFNLAVTISIRNPNPDAALEIEKADYYDSSGKLVRKLLTTHAKLAALETLELKIPESDTEGGSGASLLLKWKSAAPVSPALVEAVMIGTASGRSVSFTSHGQIISSGN